MIRIPLLSLEELEELDELQHNKGFTILIESIKHTIREHDVALANWDFDFYRDKGMDGTEEFRKTQMETTLLKEFLNFITNCEKMSLHNIAKEGSKQDVYL